MQPTNLLVDPQTRGVKNVVVWLRPDDQGRTKTFPIDKVLVELRKSAPSTYTIGMKEWQYDPRIVAARSGDRIHFQNTVAIPVNLNYSSDSESFNVFLKPATGYTLWNPLEYQRTPIMFKDDLHPWMGGRVRVFDHPYFATTDKDDNFEIKDAPIGKWRIVY